MRWISAAEVTQRLTPRGAIDAVADALAEHQAGAAAASGRVIDSSSGTDLALMPGHVGAAIGFKAITLSESNPALGLPTIQGVVVAFSRTTGALLGVVDGPSLTGLRTAAIAGVATRILAPELASTMLMVGAGAQAPHQIEAILAVRPIQRVLIWNRSLQRAEELARTTAERHPGVAVEVVASLRGAAREAQVITLATASVNPLLFLEDLSFPCHINAMGSYRPDRRELDSSLVAAARVYADTVEGCLEEAGDLIIPIAEGRLSPASIQPLQSARREAGVPVTVMKSVGSAIFDLACAARLLEAMSGPAQFPLTVGVTAQEV